MVFLSQRLITPLLAAVLLSAPVWAMDRSQARTSGTASPDALVDLLLQMDLLQNEVKQLRNQVEVQAREIERLNTRQRDLLEDLHQRVTRLEGGQASASAPAAAPQAPKNGATATVPAAAATAAVPAASVATREQEQREYDAAFDLMKQGFYERAVKAFRKFLVDHSTSPLAGNAQYWIAEANYVVRNFKLALEEFQKVPKSYPSSIKVPDAMLKIAYTYYELEQWDKARAGLNTVIEAYPKARIAQNAKRRLERMKKEGH